QCVQIQSSSVRDILGMWVVFDQTLFQDIAEYHGLIYQISYEVRSMGKYHTLFHCQPEEDSVYVKIPAQYINRESMKITLGNQFHWETPSGLSYDTLFLYEIPNPLYLQNSVH
ncbi:MAG: hypothetical protein AAFQ98_26895, partial [Bacteroidota bacterium]